MIMSKDILAEIDGKKYESSRYNMIINLLTKIILEH